MSVSVSDRPAGSLGIAPGTASGTAYGGFFAGAAWLLVVPGLLISLGSWLWPEGKVPGLVFTALVTLGLPALAFARGRVRGFAAWMFIGMVVTLAVVLVAVLALWVLVTTGE